MNKEQAKERISQLVDKFNSQIEYYKSTNYNETQTRCDFIDPFFAALGWDIDNEKQQLETYRDVRHEDKIRINGHTKAPDYSFNIQGKRKFFVEAKKPAVPIKVNPEPALQVRNYGWNGKLLISVVTDFEEFAIYDCTKKIRKNDNATSKRLKYIYFTDYINDFDFIWETFAFENVVNQSVETYAKSNIDLKKAEPVDKEFLLSLDKWREYLATSIALRNKQLDEDELNFAVQQTIDRIVFLRVCEDRKIEQEGYLLQLAKAKGEVYQNLYAYFTTANQKYNSGLFDFNKDKITKEIVIENKVIKNIITELYETGFNFAVMPVEILGYAYEQFLGKVIRLTLAHHAVIEEKPEVRKAGGVFYTPDYIVNYIVLNTVGKLIENKTPEEISKIKILDPSCGSGSFLLGAYQYLLEYHLFYYYKNKTNKKLKENPLTADNQLTSQEKKRILLNNIFGVDIDTQAVEVTKLSLLLKALEGETEASINTSLQLFNERVLPTIDKNIQCGNSLIAPDFYNDGLFLTPKEERKINVFDWKMAFPDVFNRKTETKADDLKEIAQKAKQHAEKALKYVTEIETQLHQLNEPAVQYNLQGGFDCVIGNPPYGAFFQKYEKSYLKMNYPLTDIEFESYLLFIQKAIDLLKQNGLQAYIVPSNLLTNVRYSKTRQFILQNTSIQKIIDLGSNVFDQASVDTCIEICKKQIFKENIVNTYIGNLNNVKELNYKQIQQQHFISNSSFIFNIYSSDKQKQLESKIEFNTMPLQKFVSFARGVEYGYKSQYITCNSREQNAKPIIAGRCIQRYQLRFEKKYVLYDEHDTSNFKNKGIYETEKILMRRIGTEITAVFDNDNYYNVCDVYNLISKSILNLKYILALLNSKLFSFYLQTKFTNSKKLFPKIPIKYLEQLPIKEIDINNKNESYYYNHLVKFVEAMLELNKRLQAATLQSEKEQLQRRIYYTDNEIDKIVYQLYDLTEEEIKIVEGK